MSLDDIERAEVLKGPQGALFGRNTIGGAINIVTEKPNLSELSGVLKARVGSYGRTAFALAINGPIIEGKLAGKLSASPAGGRRPADLDDRRTEPEGGGLIPMDG